MKRLVFCFDGTWNELDAKNPTNVVALSEMVMPFDGDTAQITYYDEGVGTRDGEKVRGGLFGHGLIRNISDAYMFLVFNYAPGDEIYIFGFSRGAYTARSFAGLIKSCGVFERKYVRKINVAVKAYRDHSLSPLERELKLLDLRAVHSPHVCVDAAEDDWRCKNIAGYTPQKSPLLKVKFIGVWDTVGAMGIPKQLSVSSLINRKHSFHDTDLSDMVQSARHAVSIDERRRSFEPTLWTNLDQLNSEKGFERSDLNAPYQQVWFPGTHGGVGGGGDIRGLSDGALLWIMFGALRLGLQFDTRRVSGPDGLAANYKDPLSNVIETKGFNVSKIMMGVLPKRDRAPGPQDHFSVSPSAQMRWLEPAQNLPEGKKYRPPTLNNVAGALDQ